MKTDLNASSASKTGKSPSLSGPGTEAPPRRMGFRLLSRLGEGSGLSLGGRFATSLCATCRALSESCGVSSRLQLLRRNLAEEEDARREPFPSLLARWGIAEEEVPRRIRSLRGASLAATILAGSCLTLGLLAPHPSPEPLATAALLSMAGCAAVSALSSLWRAQVLARRRFVPFLTWLVSSPPGRTTQAPPQEDRRAQDARPRRTEAMPWHGASWNDTPLEATRAAPGSDMPGNGVAAKDVGLDAFPEKDVSSARPARPGTGRAAREDAWQTHP